MIRVPIAVAGADRYIVDLKLEVAELRRDLRVLKWMAGAVIALACATFALQWQIMLRLP